VRDTQLLQTPALINHLKDTIRAHSVGQQGRTRTADQNAMMLLSLHEAAKLAAPGTPPNQIIGAVARAHIMSPESVRAASDRFKERLELVAPVKPMEKRVLPNNPKHARFLERGPSLAVQKLLYTKIAESQATNCYASVRTLRLDIKEELGVEVPHSTLKSWMKPLGFVYDEKKLSGLSAEDRWLRARTASSSMTMRLQSLKSAAEKRSLFGWMSRTFTSTTAPNSYGTLCAWGRRHATALSAKIPVRVSSSSMP